MPTVFAFTPHLQWSIIPVNASGVAVLDPVNKKIKGEFVQIESGVGIYR